jgi:hypothetical protein
MLLRVDIALLEIVDLIPIGILDGKRNFLIYIRPRDIADIGSRSYKVIYILAEVASYNP